MSPRRNRKEPLPTPSLAGGAKVDAPVERGPREDLRVRLRGLVDALVDAGAEGTLPRAIEQESDVAALGVLAESVVRERGPLYGVPDPGVLRRLRLAVAREALLARSGGVLTTAEAAEYLGTSSEAVRKRLERGRLLGYRTPSGERRLPAAQFSGTGPGTLSGLEEVLEAMHVDDDWMRIQLFLDDDVLGALRSGDIAAAREAADRYLPEDEGQPEPR